MIAATVALGGCATFVAHQIEHPAHRETSPDMARLARLLGQYQQQQFHTSSGLRIAYWYATPHAPRETGELQMRFRHGRLAQYALTDVRPLPPGPVPPTLGSVVLLPPWGQNAAHLAMWGMGFSHAGYVTVMPDLRGQGDSGDAPVGYGPREAGDIVQLVRALERRHALPGPLYLFGVSYGATVALFAAPELPEVRGVLALEPYGYPVHVIERAPASGLFGPAWLAHFIGPRTMAKAIARADRHLGIDLARIDPAAALAGFSGCTLLIHGSDDKLISGVALKALSAQSNRAQYVEVPGDTHITLVFGKGLPQTALLAWMREVPAAGGAPCPAFRLPVAPVSMDAPTHQ
jgi:pimeloyl-ACP methyl ester carboxylesterase